MLESAPAAGILHEDLPHGLGGGEEVAAAVPVLRLPGVHQPQVCLMHQGGGLERLPRLLLGQPLRRQLPQLVVDQRQELPGGVRVTLFDCGQDVGHLHHRRPRMRDRLDGTAGGPRSGRGEGKRRHGSLRAGPPQVCRGT
jgi:hypothetical protein